MATPLSTQHSALSIYTRMGTQHSALKTSLLVLAVGLGVGLAVAFGLMEWLMAPSREEMAAVLRELSTWGIASVAVGLLLYQGVARYSRSLRWTLAFGTVWAAVLGIFNVWGVARLMFFETHDYTLAIILLIFAAIVATSFGISATTRMVQDLGRLSHTAEQLAEGDLTARAAVQGQDEFARVATSFNQMAGQLQAAERQRTELDKMRRDLIAWTSHDLRTPLTSIRAMIEALHDGVVTDEAMVQRYYQTIRADIVALNSLLDDLFELAQLDAGGLQLDFQPHALRDLVSDALESFHALAQQKGVSLSGTVSAEVDPVVLNAPKIGRVLANLIQNALAYTPAGGQVQVAVQRTAVGVQLTVQDSGPGFPPADLGRVFDKFYRGEEARTRAKGGAGLGLAIARGIVEAHAGQITAANAPNGGAIITVLLPK